MSFVNEADLHTLTPEQMQARWDEGLQLLQSDKLNPQQREAVANYMGTLEALAMGAY